MSNHALRFWVPGQSDSEAALYARYLGYPVEILETRCKSSSQRAIER